MFPVVLCVFVCGVGWEIGFGRLQVQPWPSQVGLEKPPVWNVTAWSEQTKLNGLFELNGQVIWLPIRKFPVLPTAAIMFPEITNQIHQKKF